jgi:hypothetical protein
LQKANSLPRPLTITSDEVLYKFYLTSLRTLCSWETDPSESKPEHVFSEEKLQEIVETVKLSFDS